MAGFTAGAITLAGKFWWAGLVLNAGSTGFGFDGH